MVQSITPALFFKKKNKKALEAFAKVIQNTAEIARPGIKFPRKKLQKKLSTQIMSLYDHNLTALN